MLDLFFWKDVWRDIYSGYARCGKGGPLVNECHLWRYDIKQQHKFSQNFFKENTKQFFMEKKANHTAPQHDLDVPEEKIKVTWIAKTLWRPGSVFKSALRRRFP